MCLRIPASFALLAALAVGSFPPLKAAPAPSVPPGIPAGAISQAHAFVLAHQGQAFLFNYAAGVSQAPFLDGVYRPFGFSYDSRQFLYLKSNGAFPGFHLYARDIQAGLETEIGGGSVLYAAWSPAAPELAYIRIDSSGRFHLVIFDLRTKSGEEVASGALHPDYLEWSPNGDQLLYLTAAAAAGAPNEHRFAFTLHQYSIGSGKETVTPDVDWARFDGATLVVASRRSIAGRRSVVGAPGQEVRTLTVAAGRVYATVAERGTLQAKRLADGSGGLESVAEGEIYAATEDGIVVRRFAAQGVQYTYFPTAMAGPPRQLTFNSAWNLPFQGSAYLVQGGVLYNGGACDGRVCLITSHSGAWGYALDWLQASDEGQGNTHILAVEDGTVVSVTNDITCNSGSPTCLVGWDDYAKPCTDTSGGLGNFVSIAHADGSYSFYGHLKSGSVQVAPNQVVTRGTYLGDQGHSGVAATYNNYHLCGDHLHFQRQTGAAPWSQSISTDFAEMPCLLSCTSAYLSQNVENSADSAAALTVALAPSTMIGAATSPANRVILSSAAPAGGATVSLASSNTAAASVPASVSVAAGATAATFAISTGAVAAPTPVTISAAYGGESAHAALTVSPAMVARVSFSGSGLVCGTKLSWNEIDLSGIAASSTLVSLSSSQPAVLSVPATVTIPAGASFAYFTASAGAVTSPTNVVVTATDGAASASASLTVSPASAERINVSAAVTGGASLTAQVYLSGPAPAGGATVMLASSSAAATVPLSVSLPAGAWSASFTVSTTVVSAPVPVTLSASYGGSTATAAVTVNAVCTVASISPAAGVTGTSVPVTITGSNFAAGSTVVVGNAGVSVAGTVVVSPTRITTTLVIGAGALPGPAGVSVSADNSSSNAVAFTIIAAVFQPVRINAGGPAYTDSAGRLWSADTGYANGGSVTNPALVTGTPDPALYQTAHWGSDPAGPPLTYRIPLPNGAYTVSLKFDDNRMDQPGRRLFDIVINGATVEKDFDIVAHAGGMFRAFDAQYPATVTNLEMVIQFVATLYFPRVCAIEVLAGTPPAPAVAALSPASGGAGASVPVTISGTNLDPSLVVDAGPAVSVTDVKVIGPTAATATFNLAAGAPAGPVNVLVTTPGGPAAPVPFWIGPAGPAVTAIIPASGVQGTTLPVAITGNNFDPSATVTVSNPGVAVSNVSVTGATRIDATFSIAAAAPAGPASVVVATSTAAAAPVTFTINPPTPVLNSITPSSGVAGSSVNVTLAGSNLAGAVLAVGGTGVSVSNINAVASQITATFLIASTAPAGTYTVTAANAGVTSNSLAFTVTVPTGVFTPIRINAGGAAYTDVRGQVWAADTGYNNGGVATAAAAIQGTNDQPLYQAWRWGPSGGTPLTYTFRNIPSGSYTVALKLDETLYSQAGQRVFHVVINGQAVLSGFDIFQAAGAKFTAVDRSIPVDVSGGQIVIQFIPVVSNPKICAIEIVGSGPSTGPVLAGIAPASGTQGASVNVVLTGANLAGAGIHAGPGITVSNVNSADTQVTATFGIAANAGTGPRNVTVTTGAGTSGGVTFTVNAPAPAFTPIRINAGGAAYTDALGRRWSADANFNNGGVSSTAAAIAGTTDQALYQVWRWGPSAGTPLTYTFNQIPNGTYTVTLKFDETLFAQPGQRVFHVLMNGQPVLSNFDIVQAAGAPFAAVDRQFTVGVSGGQIAIQFVPVVSNPKICAIQIE